MALHIDGERVSVQWFVLLTVLRRDDHINYHVSEGRRTMARQWYFFRCYQCQCCNNGNLAAFPSPVAPHIRVGRFDHAIDFDNAEAVRQRAAQHGVTLTRTVPGEEWHLEANAGELGRFYQRHRASVLGLGWRTLRPGMRGHDVQEAMRLLQRTGHFSKKRRVGKRYGRHMKHAVRTFKRAHHLPHDGVLGPRAIKALRKAA